MFEEQSLSDSLDSDINSNERRLSLAALVVLIASAGLTILTQRGKMIKREH